MTGLDHIRNFALVAHIDHGKSTLADRLIELCAGLPARQMRARVLDSMELERERGITIKAQTVRLDYRGGHGAGFCFNLIDTPGHTDFSYEVGRSLAACEGALLLIDASQGVEAQTLANAHLALEHDLEIIPVLNKIDLPTADRAAAAAQIEAVIGLDPASAVAVSAKSGAGVETLLAAIARRLPPPQGARGAPLKALIIDSWYDAYLGVVVLVRIFDGVLKPGMKVRMLAAGTEHVVDRIGVFRPAKTPAAQLAAGEIGYLTASIRSVAQTRIGDTITGAQERCGAALAGFRAAQPVVFCGFFPADAGQFEALRAALEKLRLNDSGLRFEAASSAALGLGFRCGFLGLLHLEITSARLSREFGIELVTTAPGVVYRLVLRGGGRRAIHNPAELPDPAQIAQMEEPWIAATIMVPDAHLGAVLGLCEERRGRQRDLTYAGGRALAVYDLPLNEVVFDFHDRLKSASRGYASFDYRLSGYEESDLAKLSIRVNGEAVDALSAIVHRSRAVPRGRAICAALRREIPRHLFKIPVQAALGGRIIARETIPALRKDVTAKCYGGDISRKRKLLDRQKAGKKRMRAVGGVEIPQKAFLAVLRQEGS